MRYCKLGRGGLMVSEVGLEVGPQAEPEALRRALELGINLYFVPDSAAWDEATGRLAEALREQRERAIIALEGPREPQAIPAHISEALERLHSLYLDLYLLGGPTAEALRRRGLGEALERLRAEGKVRLCGAVVGDARRGLALVESDLIDALAFPFGPEIAMAGRKLLAAAWERQVGAIARVGIPTDPRLLAALAQEPQRSAAQAALAWSLSEPKVAAAMVAADTVPQVEEAAAASDLAPLPPETLRRLAALQEQKPAAN